MNQAFRATDKVLVNDYAVFARVNPVQKLALVKKLQLKHNVGFLGDGINDAPALKVAHVGLAVDNAADVAKDAADIILLRKSLRVIIDGVEEGRKIVANTMKYLNVTLTSNISNFYSIALVSLMIDFLPMLPFQILLVNLLSDFPMIAIAADSIDHTEIAKPKTYDFKMIIGIAIFFGLISSMFDFLFFSLFLRQTPQVLQTMWFIFSILTELVFFYIIRTKQLFFQASRPPVFIISLSLIACVVAVGLPKTALGQSVFAFINPTISDYGILLVVVMSYFCSLELMKFCYYRWIMKNGNHYH